MPVEVKIHRSGHRINYEIIGTLADVQDACAQIEKHFHPAGYGTTFGVLETVEPDNLNKWRAIGHRWDSCD